MDGNDFVSFVNGYCWVDFLWVFLKVVVGEFFALFDGEFSDELVGDFAFLRVGDGVVCFLCLWCCHGVIIGEVLGACSEP